MDNNGCNKDGHRRKCGYLGLSIIVTMTSLSNLIYVADKFGHSFIESSKENTESTLVCLKCKLLSNNSAVLNTLATHIDDGEKVCCAHSMEQLSAVLEMVKKRLAINNDISPQILHTAFDGAASAHKNLLPPVLLSNNTDMSPHFKNDSNVYLMLNAREDNSALEHSRNVEVLSTGLHILQSGPYHVYSSINFSPGSDIPCKDYPQKTWYHSIVRRSLSAVQRSGTILQSVYTCCDNCPRGKETSYTAGVFDLRAGDHLHVEVSGYGLMSFQTQSSYMGLVMLGGRPETSF